jgi:hypothetical protein
MVKYWSILIKSILEVFYLLAGDEYTVGCKEDLPAGTLPLTRLDIGILKPSGWPYQHLSTGKYRL